VLLVIPGIPYKDNSGFNLNPKIDEKERQRKEKEEAEKKLQQDAEESSTTLKEDADKRADSDDEQDEFKDMPTLIDVKDGVKEKDDLIVDSVLIKEVTSKRHKNWDDTVIE